MASQRRARARHAHHANHGHIRPPSHLQEQVEGGVPADAAAAATLFAPALADFDALLRLRCEALPGADCALLAPRAALAAALKQGFVEAEVPGAAEAAAPGSRAQAMLHAIPAGACGFALAEEDENMRGETRT